MNTFINESSVAHSEQEWELQEASHYSQPEIEGDRENQSDYFLTRTLQSIQKVASASAPFAKQLAPIAAKTLAGTTPNSVAGNLLKSVLQVGESSAVAMEALFFGTNAAEAEVSNAEAAYEAAFAEVLAAEASHSGSESEAEAFLGAAIPSIVQSMGGRRVLRAIVPTLVLANARLVRLLHQKGPPGRRLLRLVPSILRRAIASLQAAHQAGRSITSNLALRLMADHAARVFGNSRVVTSGIIRNAVLQKRTTRKSIKFEDSSAWGKPPNQDEPIRSPLNLNSRRTLKMATQYEAMFETPASHYNNAYANSEFENEWETNSEFENEWETNSEFENEWETNSEFENEWEASNAYNNSEYENEWETNSEFENEWESNPYSNPELLNEWEVNPYSNPKLSQEGEYFFKSLGKGLKSLAKVAAPLAKKLAPIAAKTLVGMIPGVGAVAAPIAGKLVSTLVQEAEMEVAQMEAALFGTNEAEAEVANNEVAHEAALTEFLAAQAAEATTEAETEAAIAAALPITISIMGGKRALRPVMPVMTQATGRLTKVLSQQGPVGKQLLRTIPTIQRQTVATLKAAARAGQPINSATAVKAMAAATNRVLSNPGTVQRAVVRNAVIRQRTAPPHPRRKVANGTRSSQCPKCATTMR